MSTCQWLEPRLFVNETSVITFLLSSELRLHQEKPYREAATRFWERLYVYWDNRWFNCESGLISMYLNIYYIIIQSILSLLATPWAWMETFLTAGFWISRVIQGWPTSVNMSGSWVFQSCHYAQASKFPGLYRFAYFRKYNRVLNVRLNMTGQSFIGFWTCVHV